jgi:lysophospholipase L1-like esterase
VRRIALIAFLTAAVASVASCGGSSQPVTPRSQAPDSERPAASADCILVRNDRARTPLQVNGTGAPVVVVADSFATGFGLSEPRDAWPLRLARRFDWTARFNTLAGSGYVNDGPCGGNTYSHLARIPPHTRLVIVEGGLNDLDVPVPQVHDAAVSLFTDLRTQARTVVVVSPTLVPGAPPAAVRDVAATIADAAHEAHVRYVDATQWPIATQADGYHPTADGSRDYAQRLAGAGAR